MRKCFQAEELDLFRYPARIICAGYSNSGKTELITRIVEKYHNKFTNIVICGVEHHSLEKHENIKHKLHLQTEIIDPMNIVDEANGKHSVLFILDDNFLDAVDSKIVADKFTKGRHLNCSTILITQNLFFKGKFARTISLNASHYILLRMRDLSQIEMLGRQIFGNGSSKMFVDVYKYAVLKKPFSHMLLDLGINTPSELQLRSNIAGEAPCEVVYAQWEK